MFSSDSLYFLINRGKRIMNQRREINPNPELDRKKKISIEIGVRYAQCDYLLFLSYCAPCI